MFWFAGSCFHTVTCICVRCGRSSIRGFLRGCCRRGAADSSCGRVRSGRASERVHRGSAVCLRHTDRAPLANPIPFHTHVFFFALCLWICVCRTACMFMDDGGPHSKPVVLLTRLCFHGLQITQTTMPCKWRRKKKKERIVSISHGNVLPRRPWVPVEMG
jgi:hypothetical protein